EEIVREELEAFRKRVVEQLRGAFAEGQCPTGAPCAGARSRGGAGRGVVRIPAARGAENCSKRDDEDQGKHGPHGETLLRQDMALDANRHGDSGRGGAVIVSPSPRRCQGPRRGAKCPSGLGKQTKWVARTSRTAAETGASDEARRARRRSRRRRCGRLPSFRGR